KLEVSVLLKRDLADDRDAPPPDVLVRAPPAHDGTHLGGVFPKQIGDVMRNLIDVVPPGAGSYQLLVQGKHGRGPALAMTSLAYELHRGVSLFTKPGLTPQ